MTAMQRSFRSRGGLPWWWWRHHANRRARSEDDGEDYYGAGTPAGVLLGDEEAGLAIDFAQNSALVRWPASPGSQFSGIPSALLTYTSPSSKYVCSSAGVLMAGTTLRTDHDFATLAPIGLRIEEARTNVVLHNRDLTNAAWVKTNITAAKDQTGVDGVANSASSITATAANGTCLQTTAIASSARCQSAYAKRLVGSGTVEMTLNGGTTWTAITITANWTRGDVPTLTLANPVVGFRLVTSGDKIAVDLVQNENGLVATSPIATTTTATARVADNISLPLTAFPFDINAGTLHCEFFNNTVPRANDAIWGITGAGSVAATQWSLIRQPTVYTSYAYADGAQVVGRPFNNASLAGIMTTTGLIRYAFSLGPGSSAVFINGVAGAADGVPAADKMANAVDTLRLGVRKAADVPSPLLWIKRLRYLPHISTNAELIGMTT
jgi:hypothetical protein